MEAETSKNYYQGLKWLFYMTWSDVENSPSLSRQSDQMTPTCPFQPSKSCKDSGKQLLYPVDYENSISNSFVLSLWEKDLDNSQGPNNPETKRGSLQTHHPALQNQLSLSFSALAVGWHPSFSAEKAKAKWKMSCEGADLAAAALPQHSGSAGCNTRPEEFLHLFWNCLSWEHTPACCVIPWLGL